MSTQDANNVAGILDYTLGSFDGSIVNLEKILQFKIGAELEEYTFNFNFNDNHEEQEEELKESKHELITEIVSELISDVCSKLPENASKEHIVIDNMSLREILEKLKCKCNEMKSKLFNTYQEDEAEEIHDEDDDAGVKERGDVSIDYSSKPGEDEMDEAGDADMSESISSVNSELQEDVESIDLNEYLDIREYAVQFVDKILDEVQTTYVGSAKYNVLKNRKPSWDSRESVKYYNDVTKIVKSSVEEENVFQYPELTIRDFKPELGKDLVQNYVKTWCITKDWMYWIEYTALRIDTCCDFYEYEVIWSLPTREYPIPQITVTVFFIIKVSRVIPDRCPVKVKYYFETCGTEFSLTDELQHEAFLNDILCQKQRTLCAIHI